MKILSIIIKKELVTDTKFNNIYFCKISDIVINDYDKKTIKSIIDKCDDLDENTNGNIVKTIKLLVNELIDF